MITLEFIKAEYEKRDNRYFELQETIERLQSHYKQIGGQIESKVRELKQVEEEREKFLLMLNELTNDGESI